MARPTSKVAPRWWDYTTLDESLWRDAARLSVKDLGALSRPGFQVHFYDTLDELFMAEALEYINAWRRATPDNPVGICGPIGPTEQLPLVARLVNELGLNLQHAHFWGMDEWLDENDTPVSTDHPLSFVKADHDLCFDRIDPSLAMPQSNMHFPLDDLSAFSASFDDVPCAVMQGGQGYVKHWAFNDPWPRTGEYADAPPSAETYRQQGARAVDLHPLTVQQTLRMGTEGYPMHVPRRAHTVGPKETWQAEKVSIWHPGYHDDAFGIRLTALMIGKQVVDTAVPMSLLAEHPNVHFHYYRHGIRPVPGT